MDIPFLIEISFWLSTLFFLFALYTILPAFSFHIIPYLNGHLYDRNKELKLKKFVRNIIKGFSEPIKYLDTNVRIIHPELGGGDDDIYQKKKIKHKITTIYKSKNSEDKLANALQTLTFNLSGNNKNVNHRDIRISEIV